MAIDNSTTFLYTYFFGNNEYSADVIDQKVDQFVIQFCIDNNIIDIVFRNGKRLYRILPKGKEILK